MTNDDEEDRISGVLDRPDLKDLLGRLVILSHQDLGAIKHALPRWRERHERLAKNPPLKSAPQFVWLGLEDGAAKRDTMSAISWVRELTGCSFADARDAVVEVRDSGFMRRVYAADGSTRQAEILAAFRNAQTGYRVVVG